MCTAGEGTLPKTAVSRREERYIIYYILLYVCTAHPRGFSTICATLPLNQRLRERGFLTETETVTVKQWKCYYDPYWPSYTYTYAWPWRVLGCLGSWVFGIRDKAGPGTRGHGNF